MISEIMGLHHVTSLASDPSTNNAFFTEKLGLRRVKKTVNFDRPDIYHLYYGDEVGTPGTVMTYFPSPGRPLGTHGTGEIGETTFSVPRGSLEFWQHRLADFVPNQTAISELFGERRLCFRGPDGDEFALVEESSDERKPWLNGSIGGEQAIRGFHSTSMRLQDDGATAELLRFMGYTHFDNDRGISRFQLTGGNGAHRIDIETLPGAPTASQGAGSVHHIAFAVKDRDAQNRVRDALLETGYQVTPVIDRDYFWAIYFRSPGGVLFEVATNEPGFDRDEERANLGTELKLPEQHGHLRASLESSLQPLPD